MSRSLSTLGPTARLVPRDPSPDRARSQVEHVTSKILEEFTLAMKCSKSEAESYICYTDLKRIWKRPRISTLLQLSRLTEAQIDFVESRMLIILSTLVFIGATDCLSGFRERFFKPAAHRALFSDTEVPYLDKLKLTFFTNSEPALQEQFFKNQFQFKPVVIEIKRSQTTQKVHPKARLPFESRLEDVGAGGFGTVDCVGVSPGYIKLPEPPEFCGPPEHPGHSGRWEYSDVYRVACKKITVAKDFDKERDNLQILKESLTSHDRIMLHLTTIEHGPSRYILLPYAAYGDLEVFLRCGYTTGPEPEMKYDFNKVFKEARLSDNITIPLLSECWSLSNALEWLHSQIKIETNSESVFCAHMDLKPANILIQYSDKSVVGKWVLSDFGISVFKEDTQDQHSEYGSIGDYISKATMNTRPTRQEGTYQAPEVKLAEAVYHQSSKLTAGQRGIGRKSDIWSFGCILAEVLAFSQGRDKFVKDFSAARGKNAKDNYFYSKKALPASKYLTTGDKPTDQPKEYEVRPSVLSWLDELCRRTASPSQWVDCWAGTIKEILVPDPIKRPSAFKLLQLLKHVKEHVKYSLDSDMIACPILVPKEVNQFIKRRSLDSQPLSPLLPPPSSLPSSNLNPANSLEEVVPPDQPRSPPSNNPNFMMFRSTTFEKKLIHLEDEEGNESLGLTRTREEIKSELGGSRLDKLQTPEVPASNLVPENELIRPDPRPIQLGHDGPDQNHRQGSSPFSYFARPAHAYGIKIAPLMPMLSKPSSTCFSLPTPANTNTKITAVAVTRSNDGARLASLAKSSIFLYKLFAESSSGVLKQEIQLPVSTGWKGIAISGNFVAAWGFHVHKLVYFCDVRNPQQQRNFSAQDVGMLDKVVVSEQGIAALICRRNILIATLKTQDIVTLTASKDQNFTHAAFNDSGDLLFAWAYGQTDKLYCWRCRDGIVNERTESESPYETIKAGNPDLIKVIPYNTYQGCIIERPDKRLFPAQIRSTLRENTVPFSCNAIKILSLQAACVFNDHSLVTIEKGIIHRYLKEYKINYQGTHTLNQPEVEICRLRSSADDSSRLLVVKNNEEIVVIVVNKNATVEFVKIVPVSQG